KNSFADEKDLSQILDEFSTARAATISLFASFNEQQLLTLGTANNNTVSVRALAAITVGHEIHHLEILNARYGLNF
ncbi:MAG TPA: DinB family protein, partial [Chitinophagales bacterium]